MLFRHQHEASPFLFPPETINVTVIPESVMEFAITQFLSDQPFSICPASDILPNGPSVPYHFLSKHMLSHPKTAFKPMFSRPATESTRALARSHPLAMAYNRA